MSAKLRMIPLCQLKPSKHNVRKTDRLSGIGELADNIAENGVLQNLVVQPNETGNKPVFEVKAGGRRLAALRLLAKKKRIPRDYRVPCLEKNGEDVPEETSLAENFHRVPLHPADQFQAFADLVQKRLPLDEVASRFGVSKTFVEQRLKLASVSPRLVAEYRAGAMTLDQLTAFTLSDDPTIQEEVWFERGHADIPASAIRRMLTVSQVEGGDRRAKFVGAKAYEEAGGVIVRDLFDSEDEGYFTDSQLLDRLVFAKLEEAAAPVRAEGWAWVEIHPAFDLIGRSQFERAEQSERELSEEEQAKLSALSDRYDELVAALEDGDETLAEEIDRVSAEIERLEDGQRTWTDEEKAEAGAIVSLGPDGAPEITRGLLKPDASALRNRNGGKHSGASRRSNGDGKANGYADSVVRDLSAYRTAAMRELLAQQPAIALCVLLHSLVEHLFFGHARAGSLRIVASAVSLKEASSSVAESEAGRAFAARHAEWSARFAERDQLWDGIVQLRPEEREQLLAHCIGMTVDALEGRHMSNLDGQQLVTLGTALGLDMRAWWRPTQANFLGRVTKNDILLAVSEGVSQQASWRLAGLKKDRMVKEAEKVLAASDWLPQPLRGPAPSTANAPQQ